MHDARSDDVIARLKRILSEREVRVFSIQPNLTRAAVLVPLLCKEGSYHILFTKRSDSVRHHKGEISFPGGARDASDADMMRTALREAYEEIGVREKDVEILGRLDDVVTMSDYRVSPFVGVIPYPYALTPSTDEIAELIFLPLKCFFKDGVLGEDFRTYGDRTEKVPIYHSGEHIIWGATARILRQFLEIISREELM